MSIAYYDLATKTPAFSFMEFVCGAVTEGARLIVVNTSQMRFEYASDGAERIRSIFPGTCALFGVELEYGPLGNREAIEMSHLPDGWIKAYHKHKKIAKIRSVLPPGKERFTVTLRDMNMQESRNSDEATWRRFAAEIGAYVIEDYRVKKISLEERTALYAGAEMNYFVVNGPMHICIFSDFPYSIFMKNVKTKKMLVNGWPVGGDLWFAHERQKCFWQPDTYENLIKAHLDFGF